MAECPPLTSCEAPKQPTQVPPAPPRKGLDCDGLDCLSKGFTDPFNSFFKAVKTNPGDMVARVAPFLAWHFANKWYLHERHFRGQLEKLCGGPVPDPASAYSSYAQFLHDAPKGTQWRTGFMASFLLFTVASNLKDKLVDQADPQRTWQNSYLAQTGLQLSVAILVQKGIDLMRPGINQFVAANPGVCSGQSLSPEDALAETQPAADREALRQELHVVFAKDLHHGAGTFAVDQSVKDLLPHLPDLVSHYYAPDNQQLAQEIRQDLRQFSKTFHEDAFPTIARTNSVRWAIRSYAISLESGTRIPADYFLPRIQKGGDIRTRYEQLESQHARETSLKAQAEFPAGSPIDGFGSRETFVMPGIVVLPLPMSIPAGLFGLLGLGQSAAETAPMLTPAFGGAF